MERRTYWLSIDEQIKAMNTQAEYERRRQLEGRPVVSHGPTMNVRSDIHIGDLALPDFLKPTESEKENMMKIYQVFFVHKEDHDVHFSHVVAGSKEVATMKAAANLEISADDVDEYEIKIQTLFDLDF